MTITSASMPCFLNSPFCSATHKLPDVALTALRPTLSLSAAGPPSGKKNENAAAIQKPTANRLTACLRICPPAQRSDTGNPSPEYCLKRRPKIGQMDDGRQGKVAIQITETRCWSDFDRFRGWLFEFVFSVKVA